MTRTNMVRQILLKNGLNPPSGLDTGTRSELGTAEEILDQVSLEMQTKHRWAFSDRLNQEITPDVDGKLNVPAGTLFAESDNYDSNLELVQVGGVLYDRQNQTDVFTNITRIRVNLLYKAECLPMHIRVAVVARAAAEYAAQKFRNDPMASSIYTKLDAEANRMFNEAVRRDMDSKRVNVLDNSPSLAPEGWYTVGATDNSDDLYWNGYDLERR